jgi:hypothetical protein
VLRLVEAGGSYRDIARQLGVSFGQIARDVRYVLDELAANSVETAARYRTLELARLDLLQLACWQPAIHGDLGAIDRALRISERRSRLLGLDLPVKVDLEARVRRVAEEEGLPVDEIMAEVQRLLGR